VNVKFRNLMLAALSTWAASSLASQDLMAVYGQALQTDPVFRAARYQLAASLEKQPQASAALRPAISLVSNASRQEGQASYNQLDDVNRTVRSSAVSLQLTQPVWRPSLRIAQTQADLQVQQAQAVFAQAQTDLMLRAAQSYFDALIARKSVLVASSQVNAVEQQLVLAKRNFESGQTTVTDLHEARSRYDLAMAQLQGAKNDSDAKDAELEKLLGQVPTELTGLTNEAVGPLPQDPDLKVWMDSAASDHPSVRAQELALRIAREEVRKARAAHGPTLDVSASYGRNSSSGSMTSPTELASRTLAGQVGVQFSFPLYAGGGLQSRLREALALVDKASADLEAARRQAMAQARQAFNGLLNGRAQVLALASAAAASKAAVESNKVGYRIGTRINIDVLNAEQQLFGAERDLYRLRADTMMQSLRLKAASGRLQESDLASLNALLKGEQ
jgi:outer membrane protein